VHSSPDGFGSEQRLATACLDGKVRIFDAANGRELLAIQAHGDKTVNCVAISPNGEHILSGSYDKVGPPGQPSGVQSDPVNSIRLLSVLSLS
jgi:WD40 repeat protein